MNSCFLFVFLGLLVTVCYAGPNCNAGLVDGAYYCFENSIPYRMNIDREDFVITANAWGCHQNLTGTISIQGSSITLKYENLEQCPRFTSYAAEGDYQVVFDEGCVGFSGFQLGDDHRVVCTEEYYYFFEEPLYYEEPSSSAWMLIPALSLIALALL